MPPKKPSGNVKKKSKASKRPSKTNLVVDMGRGRNRNTERSVMQTLEEPTANNEAGPNQKKTQAPAPSQPINSKPKDFTRTVMLPPPAAPAQSAPAPNIPQMPQPPAQGSQMPQMAPVARPPQLTQPQVPQYPLMNQNPADPMPPAPRPPPGVVNQSLASPSPSTAQLGPKATMALPSPGANAQPSSPAPPQQQTPEPLKRASREKDDGSVDGAETSDKKKKNDVITSWMRLTLQCGVEGLKKEYRDSFNEAPMERATAFSDNPTKNRYNNIPCCDTTRVVLADDPYFYIHANLVSSGPNPRRFICTQAPLNGTIEDFWKMIIVCGLEYIIMLCELVEKGKPKSAEYFPVKLGDTMKIGKLCTVTKEASVDLDKTLTMSTMRISKPGDSSVVKIVKHIHWRNWPDHGVPDNFLSPFRLLAVVKSCTKPVIVHCSAGVGRTGTLALILIILESLLLSDFLGVPRLLTKLRDERFKSIQTEMQYLYVHRCILEYLVLKKFHYNRDDYAKFSKEYETALAACGAEK